MHKKKIKLTTPEMMSEFIDTCSKYDCDVNIYDGRAVRDAKSIIGVFAIAQGKEIYVQAITSNEDVIVNFIKDMKKFEV